MASEKEMLFGDVKIPPKKLMNRLWKYIRPVIWPLVFSFVLLIINVVVDIYLPLLLSKFIENEVEGFTVAEHFSDGSEAIDYVNKKFYFKIL